jgi:hypothetical protein
MNENQKRPLRILFGMPAVSYNAENGADAPQAHTYYLTSPLKKSSLLVELGERHFSIVARLMLAKPVY